MIKWEDYRRKKQKNKTKSFSELYKEEIAETRLFISNLFDDRFKTTENLNSPSLKSK